MSAAPTARPVRPSRRRWRRCCRLQPGPGWLAEHLRHGQAPGRHPAHDPASCRRRSRHRHQGRWPLDGQYVIRVRGVPIYWGIETEPVDRSFWCYSVLHETLPPFRHSTYGLRIRISLKHWLHVGTFLYDRNPNFYSLRLSPDEIRKWKGGIPQEEPEPDLEPSDEVRRLDDGGRLHGAGDDGQRGDALAGPLPPV